MLAYSLSLNGLATVLPLKKIAAAFLAQYFWSMNFSDEMPTNLHKDLGLDFDLGLANHRENVFCIMNNFVEENNLPSSIKEMLKESICLLCQACCRMLLWQRKYPSIRFDIYKKIDLYTPRYFNAVGEFNDFIWAKRFVLNSINRMDERFYLACSYWFENETSALWPAFKRSDLFSDEDLDENYDFTRFPFFMLRVYQLENKLEKLARNLSYAGHFWQVGFKKAVESGYDYAAYYFWQNISESEKRIITENDSFFELMCQDVGYPDRLCFFLYSQLSGERKRDFLEWSIAKRSCENWTMLLISPYSESARFEILEFINQFPIEMYCKILVNLSIEIRHFKTAFDNKMFLILWNNLTPDGREFVLKACGNYLIRSLIFAKSFYNLGHILSQLSNEQKDQCLFGRLYGGTVDGLDILELMEALDLVQEYLIFFFVEIDPVTQKKILRQNAGSLLQRFTQEPCFLSWYESRENEKQQIVGEQITALQNRLALPERFGE